MSATADTRRDPARLVLALFAAGVLVAAFPILRGYEPHDEGLMLQWASRVAGGEWPYRDFWANYGPGQIVVLAGLVKVLGPSLLWWRIVRVLIGAVVAVLAFRLVRRDAPLGWALAAWVAVAGAMAFPLGPGPNPPALALALGAVLLARRSPAGAGALAGVATVFRPELGIAAIAGVVLAERGAGRALAAFAVAGAVVWAPFLIVAPGDLWDQTAGFLGDQHLQRLPFPFVFHGPWRPSKLIEFYAPLILVAAAAAWVLAALARRPGRRLLGPLPLALVGLAYLLGRTDEFHLVPLAAVLPILLATLGALGGVGWTRLVLAVALVLVALLGVDRQAGQLLHPPDLAALRLPAADGVRAVPADASALRALYRYVRARERPGAPLWVANPRHDLVRVGDTMLYVLLDGRNPTRYDTMQPGVITTAAVQQEIVRDLRRTPPRIVVRWLNPTADRREPNGAGRSSGVRILDRYLAATYRPTVRFGDYRVLERRAS